MSGGAHSVVAFGLLVPVAVVARALLLRSAANEARSGEEDAFARAHDLTVERDDAAERTVMRSDALSVELAKDETTVTVVAPLAEGEGRFWIQPSLVVTDPEKTRGLVRKGTLDEEFDEELKFYCKAKREVPRALSSDALKRALIAMRPLESGLRIERTTEAVIVRVQDRALDPGTLETMIGVAHYLSGSGGPKELTPPPRAPTLEAKARLWMNVARIATPLACVVALPGAAVPPIRQLGDMVSCPPGQTVGSHSTGKPRTSSGMRSGGGNTTLVCMTPELEITGPASLWMFAVSFEIYFVLVACVVAAISIARRPRSIR